MLNPLESYSEAGRKAALAQNVDDAATVRHWREYFQRMRALETGPAKAAAQRAYERAYTAARNVPR
jgi:hypothetical protein